VAERSREVSPEQSTASLPQRDAPHSRCFRRLRYDTYRFFSDHPTGRADWAVWQPDTCQVGGPVGQPGWWAATSNVEVVQTTYPVNRDCVVMEGREWNCEQSHKEEEREGGSGTGEGAKGPFSEEGAGALFGYLCSPPPPPSS